jgi:hypothetical protein
MLMKLLIVNLSPSLFEAPEEVLALPIGSKNDEKKNIINKDVHAKDPDMFKSENFLLTFHPLHPRTMKIPSFWSRLRLRSPFGLGLKGYLNSLRRTT